MKKKDIFYMLLAVGILMVAGFLAYTQIAPQKTGANAGVEVDKVGEFAAEFDAAALAKLTDTSKVIDYSSAVDLTGLNNKAPFGP